MKLIVNADDFGYSPGVNHGIIDAYARGVVNSATLMATGTAFRHAIWLAKKEPGLGIGVHLTLTMGTPLTPGLRTLTGPDGAFLSRDALAASADSADTNEIEREFTAQIDRVLQEGLKPTHLDSHHHIHMDEPFFDVFARICARYGLPARCRRSLRSRLSELGIPTPDAFIEGFHGEDLREDILPGLFAGYQDFETVELMCHPAYLDQTLLFGSSYALPRARELEILTGSYFKEFVRRSKFRLVGYRCLATPHAVSA